MRALIVEDSRLARQELKHLLQAFPDVALIGEASNADEARSLIEKTEPDLLFLDIQMPGKDGFELLEALDHAPAVIFTTAYDQYALKAFEVSALDYLQKPVQKDRLAAAIRKAQSMLASNAPPADSKTATVRPSESPTTDAVSKPQYLEAGHQVFVKDGDRCWFVKLADIRLFEIDGSYTRIRFSEHKPMIPKTLNQLEARLDPSVFFRANRQQIINLRFIESIEPWFSGSLKATLTGGETIEISRRQTAKFKELTSL